MFVACRRCRRARCRRLLLLPPPRRSEGCPLLVAVMSLRFTLIVLIDTPQLALQQGVSAAIWLKVFLRYIRVAGVDDIN